jgi:hypothetical protein
MTVQCSRGGAYRATVLHIHMNGENYCTQTATMASKCLVAVIIGIKFIQMLAVDMRFGGKVLLVNWYEFENRQIYINLDTGTHAGPVPFLPQESIGTSSVCTL